MVIPEGSEVMHVAEQDGDLMMWYLCDPSSVETEVRNFRAFYTGEDIPDDFEGLYITTVLQDNGIVLHIFETE